PRLLHALPLVAIAGLNARSPAASHHSGARRKPPSASRGRASSESHRNDGKRPVQVLLAVGTRIEDALLPVLGRPGFRRRRLGFGRRCAFATEPPKSHVVAVLASCDLGRSRSLSPRLPNIAASGGPSGGRRGLLRFLQFRLQRLQLLGRIWAASFGSGGEC